MKRPKSLTEKTAANEPTARNSCFSIVKQPMALNRIRSGSTHTTRRGGRYAYLWHDRSHIRIYA